MDKSKEYRQLVICSLMDRVYACFQRLTLFFSPKVVILNLLTGKFVISLDLRKRLRSPGQP